MALAHRLHDVGLLTDWQYRSTCRQLAELGYRSAEPDNVARETSQVLREVFALLRGTGRTPASVTAALHIPLSELHALMFGLSIAARTGAGSGTAAPADRPVLRVVPGARR